ncbi:MAG: hypothetical protein HY543_02675 [Deltaproteobacteria bacterium]|nr:hypothetical protein [Deltaproteobacteria bacterium]
MGIDGISAIRQYLLAHFDDPQNGARGAIDALEVAAFLQTEGLAITEKRPRELRVTEREFTSWREQFATRVGQPSILTVTFAEFTEQILPAAAPILRAPDRQAGRRSFERRPVETQITASRGKKAGHVAQVGGNASPGKFSRILAVGDAQASRETNSALTVQLARPNMPTTREYVIPVDPHHEMRVIVAFDSVDWPTGAHNRLGNVLRPSRAFIVPTDYHGEYPPTPDSIAQWRSAHLARYPYHSPFGLSAQQRLGKIQAGDLFFDVSPTQRGNQVRQAVLPAGPYQLVVQAGQRDSATDRFDNFVVTLTGENLQADPEFGDALRSTVILGEEVYAITAPQPDGTLAPLPDLPSTSDAGTYLYSQAYVQYHPVARDFRAAANRDTRIFRGLRPGERYNFSVDVRGIDHEGFQVQMQYLPDGDAPHTPTAHPSTKRDDPFDTASTRTPNPRTPSDRARLADLARRVQPLEAVLTRFTVPDYDRYVVPTHRPWSLAVVRGLLADAPQREDSWKSSQLVLERDDRDRYFVSAWVRGKGAEPFQFLARSLPLSETAARYLLEQVIGGNRPSAGPRFWERYDAYQGRWEQEALREEQIHATSSAVHSPSQRTLRASFIAKGETILVMFSTPSAEWFVRRDRSGWPVNGRPYDCDELRFDNIRLVNESKKEILPDLP